MNGLIVFAHGSSIEAANDSVRRLVTEITTAARFDLVQAAFLELSQPDLRAAVSNMAASGISRIVIVPYFLTPGIHLGRDLPRLVEELRACHPDIHIDVTEPLDRHPALRTAVMDRAEQALKEGGTSESQVD